MAKLHWERYGSGKSIVMVHGWAMHSGIWREFARQLGQSFQVTCVDLPGHGRSEPIDRFDLDQVTEQLAEWSEQFSVCWLGWSMGANIVLELARRFPERVDSLIVLAGNPRFTAASDWPGIESGTLDVFADNLADDCRATLLRFLALQTRGVGDSRALLNRVKQAIDECDIPNGTTLLGGLDLLKSVDQRADLPALVCPSLIILGAQDTLVPSGVAPEIQALSPASCVHVLEKTGHLPFLTRPDGVMSLISEFLIE